MCNIVFNRSIGHARPGDRGEISEEFVIDREWLSWQNGWARRRYTANHPLYTQLRETVSKMTILHVNQKAEVTQEVCTENGVLDISYHKHPPESTA